MKTYMTEIVHGDALPSVLNHFASKGWRLVSLCYLDMGNYRYVMEADAEEQRQRKEQASAEI